MKKKSTETSVERSTEVATKMNEIFAVIETLTKEDVAYLKNAQIKIREDVSKREAVAGVLVPLDKAEMANALGRQGLDRITGIILIWAAINSVPEILREYREKAVNAASIERMFGL